MFVNAVVDALKDFGVRHNDMPLTTLQVGERGCGPEPQNCQENSEQAAYGHFAFLPCPESANERTMLYGCLL